MSENNTDFLSLKKAFDIHNGGLVWLEVKARTAKASQLTYDSKSGFYLSRKFSCSYYLTFICESLNQEVMSRLRHIFWDFVVEQSNDNKFNKIELYSQTLNMSSIGFRTKENTGVATKQAIRFIRTLISKAKELISINIEKMIVDENIQLLHLLNERLSLVSRDLSVSGIAISSVKAN